MNLTDEINHIRSLEKRAFYFPAIGNNGGQQFGKHMRYFSQTILLLLFMFCAAGSGVLAEVGNPSSERFPTIQASLDDGFFSLAEQQARGVLLTEPNEADRREATLLLAHSLWGQKRYSEVLRQLMEEDNGPDMAYWRARAYFELRQYENALDALLAGDEGMEGTAYAPAALRLKGRMQQLMGRLEEAEKTYKQFARDYPWHAGTVDNMLDLADVYLAQERYSEARSLYEALLKEPDETGAHLAQLKLAHVLYTTGDAGDVAAARTLLGTLASDETTSLAYRIDAYVDLAALEEQAGRFAESVADLRKGIALSPDARLRVSLKLSLARMLLRADDISGALKLLEECRTEAPDRRVAAELQLEKAGAFLQAERFGEADEAYQVYLDVADDPQGLARAYFGKGVALWGLGRYVESATLFDKAELALTDSDEKAAALIKAGDAYYQAGRLDESEKRYRRFLSEYAGNENMPGVFYQLGMVLAKIGRRSEALTTFDIVETSYPDSSFAEKAAMRSADIMRANGQWEEALQKYTRISETYTNSAEVALAQHYRGLVLYRLGRYADAQKVFEYEAENHPDSEHAPQAFYMRGFCLYSQGHVDEAVETCRQFIKTYPDTTWTPEVIFWLAELYFNQGKYTDAEPLFLQVANDFKEHALAPRALYWAGRAASAQSDYVSANERYSAVAKRYPDSDILPQVRFAQGDALTEIGEFSRAIQAFDEIIRKYPDSGLVNAAWGRKGDCQFSLAVDSPARYEEAMNSYQAILDRPSAPDALKMEAEYAVGRCLEELGMFDKAFSRYMNVVYSFKTVDRTPHSGRWLTRSAFAAAALKENEEAWKDAVNIYERVVEADVAAKDDALKRIEKIKKANWLLFQQAEEMSDVGTDD